MDDKIVKLDAELVIAGKHKDKLAKRQQTMKEKAKLMQLRQSKRLHKKIFRELPAEEGIELYKKTQLGRIMMNGEAAILALEKAANGDLAALEEYRTYVQAGVIISTEMANFKKVYEDLKPIDESRIPKPYKAPELTKEEWEKKFNPGKPLPQEESNAPDMYTGPTPSSVN